MMKYFMKRMPILLGMLLLTTLTITADSFYDEYSESERLVIAGAYLAVGDQYDSLGEKEKGEAFRNLAELIFPGIESTDIPEQGQEPEAGALQTSAPVRPSGKEPAAIQYYFSKLMRAVFSEDAGDVSSLLTTRLYLPGYDEGIEKKEVLAFVKAAFERYPLDSMDPTDIYDLDRLYIRPEGSAWTAGIKPTEEGREIFYREFGFRGEMHKFYFREYREGWRLIALSAE
jgi:hypothetical protein